MANGRTGGGLVVTDLIEGEFTVEVPSGLSCRGCWTPLLVGCLCCPRCGRSFALPTPDLGKVPPGPSPARAAVMTAIYRDRISTAETERVNAIVHPPVTNPLYIQPV